MVLMQICPVCLAENVSRTVIGRCWKCDRSLSGVTAQVLPSLEIEGGIEEKSDTFSEYIKKVRKRDHDNR